MASTYLIMAKESGSDLLQYAVAGCLELLPACRCCYSRPVSTPTAAFSRATTHRQKQLGAMTTGRPRSEFQRALRQHAGLNTVCADANPYLVLAAVLAGIWHGIENKLTPPSAIEGNAWDQDIEAPKLATTMDQAIDVFRNENQLADYLSEEFKTLFWQPNSKSGMSFPNASPNLNWKLIYECSLLCAFYM